MGKNMQRYCGQFIDVGCITGEEITVDNITYMKTDRMYDDEVVVVPPGVIICHLCDYISFDGELIPSYDGWFMCGSGGVTIQFVDVDNRCHEEIVECPAGTQIKVIDHESGVCNPGTLAIKFPDVNYYD